MKKMSVILTYLLLLLAGCAQPAGEPLTSPDVESASSVADQPSTLHKTAASEVTESSLEEIIEEDNTLSIRLAFDGGEAIVVLEDNVAARGWYSQLPMTQTFEEFHGREKICRIPDETSPLRNRTEKNTKKHTESAWWQAKKKA